MDTTAPTRRGADLLAAAAGLGLVVTVALAVSAESPSALSAPGGVATALGRLTGLLGAYAMLLMVLLVARLPALERVVGQDRLLAWHRLIGGWPIVLIALHGVLIVVGYAQAAKTGALHELGVLLTTYPGVLAGTAGFALLLMAGVTSYRIVRRRMAYETWWVVHLYTYLALALAFSHQVTTGAAFVGHPFVRAWWTALWLGTAGLVLAYRVALPVWRSLRHRLRVVAVEHEAPGVVSLVCRGHRLDRLAFQGGQFLQWRFLARGLWWQAHPYSPSALVHDSHLRVTVRDLGDHSGLVARLKPGTRIAVEGPYGTFTKHARRGDRVLLVGAGVGVTPLRALLEDLPAHVHADVILRASNPQELVLHEEMSRLAARRGGRVHELVGPRADVRVDREALRGLVPDLAERDVYVCGPDGFADRVVRAARGAGVGRDRIHRESFAF